MAGAPAARVRRECASQPGGGEGNASGGAYAAGNLWGSLPGSVAVEKRVRAGKFFARSLARALTEPSRGGMSILPTGQAKKASGQPVGVSIVPPREEPVKAKPDENFSSRGTRNGRLRGSQVKLYSRRETPSERPLDPLNAKSRFYTIR